VETLSYGKLAGLGLLAVVAVYVAFTFAARVLASKLLYHPEYGASGPPAEAQRIRGSDGREVVVVYLPQPGAEFTLWFFHGNAVALADTTPKLRAFREAGFSVFAVEYPGYGGAPGAPSEAEIYTTARAARRYLREELKVPAEKTLLAGQSLGGGPAVQLATEEQVGGLLLFSSFLSAYRVLFPWPRFPFDPFDKGKKLPDVKCPVLVVHGEADQVIPFRHGQTLFALAPEPKRALWVPNAGHNDLPAIAGKSYWDAISAFRALCSRRVSR
jgi:fermentation-respiration switch protein FrsA (DUF1100 family)